MSLAFAAPSSAEEVASSNASCCRPGVAPRWSVHRDPRTYNPKGATAADKVQIDAEKRGNGCEGRDAIETVQSLLKQAGVFQTTKA